MSGPKLAFFGWLQDRAVVQEEGREDQRDDGHELEQNVERGAAGVLERVAHGVADNCCLVVARTLAAEVARLNELLGVVPRAARVGPS